MRYILACTIYLPYNLKVLFNKLKNKKYNFTLNLFKKTKKEISTFVNISGTYVPERKTEGAAAYDLIAKLNVQNIIFKAGETILVPTGFSIEIPKNKCGLILIRSGLSINSPLGLANGVGLIDSDYRGEIKIPLRNFSPSKRYTINNGDRIAQLLLIDCFTPVFNKVKELSKTDRNSGGFGSTGTK